ncbi:MAG: Type 1 glutamine amidotransferase-like domain-containing protein, partial [Solirubrobacterales bacterium]|nr:Type 1 glutamine amidotransferase-like domain-containing protein [Solirubrobacterales bacterium]
MRRPSVVAIEERSIFAMGGGGFTMEPNNPLLDDYVLSLTRKTEPRILFLPTASGDTSAQINAFKARFAHRTCVAEHVSLFRLRETPRPLEDLLFEQDIV